MSEIRRQRDLPVTPQRARRYVILTALGYSFMGVALKFVDWHPLVISCLRSALAIPMIAAISGRFRILLNKKTVIGAFFSFACSTCFVVANKLTSATNAIALQYTNPLFVVLYCALVRKESMRRKDLLLLAVASGGMGLFFLDGLSHGNMAGNAVALLSGMLMAGGTLYACYSQVEITDYILLSHVLGVLAGLPFLLWQPPRISAESVGAVLFMAVVCITAPHFLFRLGVRSISPVETSVLLMLDPILNPVWVALIVREVPSALSVCGALLVIASVVIWCTAGKKSLRKHA